MNEYLDRVSHVTGMPLGVARVLLAVGGALLVGSCLRAIRLFLLPIAKDESRKRFGSLATWWVLYGCLLVIAAGGEIAAILLFAIVSLVGLREFRNLATPRMAIIPGWWAMVFVAVPVHYLIIYLDPLGPSWTFLPVWVLVVLLARLATYGQTTAFMETAGITFLGVMLVVFLFSHPLLLFHFPKVSCPSGGVGLFVYLLLLTEGNDIAQSQWGRAVGRHKITPLVSPHKTWEGFLLGMATTVLFAVVLAAPLTPFVEPPARLERLFSLVPSSFAALTGVVIAGGGFLGDIAMSAVKREVGVKDSGTLLPGQGGILDRIDSLTFTGPLFFYLVYLFYG